MSKAKKIAKDKTYPMLSLRDIVVMPGMIAPLFVGREKSIKALEYVMKNDLSIFLATQHDTNIGAPKENEIYSIGVLANIIQMLKLPDGTVKVLIEGLRRAKNIKYLDNKDYFECQIEEIIDQGTKHKDIPTLISAVTELFENYAKTNNQIGPDLVAQVLTIKDPSKLADTIATHLSIKIVDKQTILETANIVKRLELVYAYIEGQLSIAKVERKIRNRVKRQMEKTQHEYYLSEQMKAIQKELGDDTGKEDIVKLEESAKLVKFSKEAQERFNQELKKLKNMPVMSAESSIVRNYLDWLIGLPWGKKKRVLYDLSRAKTRLDHEHYGLEKVKDRIIEHLAVQKRSKKSIGPILCFVGPPGVGKTSLGKSIAESCGREFIRISLGGIRDEAEIRGHRRTYIGAMPGKIIQALKGVKSSNPLIMLDELDKMGSDYRGDPSYAMLELLDTEQNDSFKDHYLDLPYDLSQVLFIGTANSLDMPLPLLDRMEIIRIAGYTNDDKFNIAKHFLINRQQQKHIIKPNEWKIHDDVIKTLIAKYTREAGVRSLDKEISNLARKVVRTIEENKSTKLPVTIMLENLVDFAGPEKFTKTVIDEMDQIGVVNGLAWTSVGGEILKIEVVKMPGKGKVVPTGNLKEVMKESISAAMSYIRARCDYFAIDKDVFEKHDIHVHVPEAATPKDGPSAGIAMVTAILSVIKSIPVKRDVAMTGEITLRGQVLPIGGLKEKLLGALQAGVKTILIPEANMKDLIELSDDVVKNLEIIPISTVDEVLKYALSPKDNNMWKVSKEKIDNMSQNIIQQ